VTSTNNDGQGVTIVTTDSLVGSHFLDSNPVTKIEIDDEVASQMQIMSTTGSPGKKIGKGEGDKKICLWDTGNGTTCGKTFTKFDSLNRHLRENHKGVRPYACTLCDKKYGRRDYLQRHLKSHNANYAVNLQSASHINASQVVQKVQVQPQNTKSNTIILQQGQGGAIQVVSNPPQATTQPSVPFLSLNNGFQQNHKPIGSKICRWVMADNTMCGKAFSKLDSLRRHVNELHKGVRPFACNMCDKNYGRRDYLDRHLRTHDPENQKKKSVTGLEWGTTNILVTEDGQEIKRVIRKKRKDIPAEEKKICLWVLEDGTACGKTFTKFDSLKRHVSEAHKGVRPFSCNLCGKNYGRRDYLLRHLKSHNEAEVASISTTRIVGSNNQVVGHVVGSSPSGGLQMSPTSIVNPNSSIRIHSNKKRLSDKKTCRWVLDNGTRCGRSFSKVDSLRRHVQELHKGVRPYVCQLCEKSYGRRDYLDRHMKSHSQGGGAGLDVSDPDSVDVKHVLHGDADATLNQVVTVVSADDDLTV